MLHASSLLGFLAFLTLPAVVKTVCSIEKCEGYVHKAAMRVLTLFELFDMVCYIISGRANLLAAIKRDLEPWRLRGGIKRKDVDEAESWRVHRNQFTRSTNDGWMRVTIANNKLYATHIGAGKLKLTIAPPPRGAVSEGC